MLLLGKRLFISDKQHALVYILCAGFLVLALALRISLYPVVTSDYRVFLSQWYDFIQTHGGFAALKYNFSNYNVPYLYLLALTSYLPIPALVAIKTLSVLFDGVLAVFTYLILRLRYQRSYAAIAAALVVLFAPTIFINSAAWGQCDAIYTAFCLGSLYFLLKDRPGWACTFFALALSFKLQAIFFLPVLFVLLLKRKLPLQYLALIPLIFLLMLVPAYLVGRSIPSLLSIYAGQVTQNGGAAGQFNGGARSFTGGAPGQGGGQFNGGSPGPFAGGAPGQGGRQFNGNGFQGNNSSSLTLNAPSFYQWLPVNAADAWKWVGILLAAAFVVAVAILVMRSKKPLTRDILLKVALVFALAIPFCLPYMHDRYFYLADVLSIIFAFSFPRLWYIALLTQLCSLLSYEPYLINTQTIALPYVAFVVLILVVITTVDLVRTLYPSNKLQTDEQLSKQAS